MARILILSVAGREIKVQKLRLYPGPEVAGWRALLTQAQQNLGGVSSGIGLLGSPGWVIGGAMVLGALESVLSSGAAKEGVRRLGEANEALKSLRYDGHFFAFDDLRNLSIPNPAAWVGDRAGSKTIDLNKVAFLDRGGLIRSHNKTKADVAGGMLRVDADILYVGLDEDFFTFHLLDGSEVDIRWSSVDHYRFDESDQGQ